ncbi:uncharacterized protein LOC116683103 [Etheostoma spectabile]|uniref:uncharacterized protein LOC116683103 n=1 Tax=Etheostoma spectabile TaxID=54343 RepID=UPI0013AED681|nr:uncharacterized protein LOC116683103 [Etheostoma spectabile]
MVSTLDIDVGDGGDEDVDREEAPVPEEEVEDTGCPNPDCQERLSSILQDHKILRRREKVLRQKLALLEKELASCRSVCRQQAKRLSRLPGSFKQSKRSRRERAEEERDADVASEGQTAAAVEEAAAVEDDTAVEEAGGEEVADSKEPTTSTAAGRPVPGKRQLFRGQGRTSGACNLFFPKSIDDYLVEYRRHHAGACPTLKQVENALSKVIRVKTFIYYLCQGKTELYTWRFLYDIKGIRE